MTSPRTIALFALLNVGCGATADVRAETPNESPPSPSSSAAAPTEPADKAAPYEIGLKRLLATRSLKCEFTTSATAKWDSGSPVSEAGPDRLALVFDAIDIKKGEARLIGNQGATDVIVAATPAGLTFIERTDGGNFMMTSVVPWRLPMIQRTGLRTTDVRAFAGENFVPVAPGLTVLVGCNNARERTALLLPPRLHGDARAAL